MLQHYAPILLLFALAALFAGASVVLSELLGRRRRNVGKKSAYECGMEPVGGARIRLSIHFYLVSVLFILFDVEAVFLLLWAATAREFRAEGLGPLVLAEVLGFVGVLGLALAWVWRKGGLEWER
jgi:NADH-quinone oxidoreductase subunit A